MVQPVEVQLEKFWSQANPDDQPENLIAQLTQILEVFEENHPLRLFELASIYDYVGREEKAAPLYRKALGYGLDGDRRSRAFIQLGSTLRNLGLWEEAIEVLSQVITDSKYGESASAFLALVLHDAGRKDEALSVALTILSTHLPVYGASIRNYASSIGD